MSALLRPSSMDPTSPRPTSTQICRLPAETLIDMFSVHSPTFVPRFYDPTLIYLTQLVRWYSVDFLCSVEGLDLSILQGRLPLLQKLEISPGHSLAPHQSDFSDSALLLHTLVIGSPCLELPTIALYRLLNFACSVISLGHIPKVISFLPRLKIITDLEFLFRVDRREHRDFTQRIPIQIAPETLHSVAAFILQITESELIDALSAVPGLEHLEVADNIRAQTVSQRGCAALCAPRASSAHSLFLDFVVYRLEPRPFSVDIRPVLEDDRHIEPAVQARLQELALLERKLVYVFGPAQFSLQSLAPWERTHS
ncbi:hypothetical protein DFH08DRAFT_1046424, partial [Mycena albidolilacea]